MSKRMNILDADCIELQTLREWLSDPLVAELPGSMKVMFCNGAIENTVPVQDVTTAHLYSEGKGARVLIFGHNLFWLDRRKRRKDELK